MIKKIITTMISMFLTLILTACNYSSGEKVGYIDQLAIEGLVIKTHEAQLIRNSFDAGIRVIGKPFNFTINDPILLPIAYKALEESKKVKIKYHSQLFAPLESGNRQNNFVDSIEIINENKES